MKYICRYCGKEFTNSGGYKMHENTCKLNPNREKNLNKRKQYTNHIINDEDITCKYCGQKFKSKSNKTQHEAICKLNPNRIARTIRQKYDMMSDEELLNEVKKYNSRKETPQQLISVCKERKIYSWTGQFGKEHSLNDEELINKLNEFNKKTDIPFTLNQELKRRNIKLPKRFNLNPKRIYNKDLQLKSDNELLDIVKDIKDKYEASEKKLLNILDELNKRHILPERFNQNIKYSKFHYYTTEKLLKIVNKYKSKNDLCKSGYGECLNELIKRNITNLPKYCLKGRFTEWHNKSDDELKLIISKYNKRKELIDAGIINIIGECKKRNIDISKFSKNYHPEYENMTDDELISIGKDIFKNVNIRHGIKINRALINQLRQRNIIYEVFPESKPVVFKNRYKLYKLNLLNKYDLTQLNQWELLTLIELKGWPKEFKQLCKFGENTPSRKQMFQDLIDSYDIDIPEEDYLNNKIENTDNIEINIISNLEDDNEKIYDENKLIGNIVEDSYNEFLHEDKFIYIFKYRIDKLWVKILRDDEHHNTNTINEIQEKLKNNSLTKFENYIYSQTIKRYNDANNLEIH